MKYIQSLILAVFLLGPITAEAASPKGKDFYGSFFVGTNFLTQDQAWSLDRSGVINPRTTEAINRRIDTTADAGWRVGAAVGGWINPLQRMELAVGYGAYTINFKDAYGDAPAYYSAVAAFDTATADKTAADAAVTAGSTPELVAAQTAAQVTLDFATIRRDRARSDIPRAPVAAAMTAAFATAQMELTAAQTAFDAAVTAAVGTTPAMVAVEVATERAALATAAAAAAAFVLDANVQFDPNFKPEVDTSTILIMFNNYFYPLQAFDSIYGFQVPLLAKSVYFGFGVGAALTSFDGVGFKDGYTDSPSVALMGAVGYEAYLGDIVPSLPKIVEGVSVGIEYQYTWSQAKPQLSTLPAYAVTNNERLHQRGHNLLVSARYEF